MVWCIQNEWAALGSLHTVLMYERQIILAESSCIKNVSMVYIVRVFAFTHIKFLLASKLPNNIIYNLSTVQFHHQYKQIESVFSIHRSIFLQDPHLKTSIPGKPKVSYRRTSNLKDKITCIKISCIPKPIIQTTVITYLVT